MAVSSRYFRKFVFPAFLCAVSALTPFALDNASASVFLDKESTECVQCHGSSVDPAFPQKVCHSGLCDHPVGVDYADLASRNPGLVKPAALNHAIRLTDGMIGCTSCHVPYNNPYDHKALADQRKNPSAPDPMLSVDNTASGLCLSCHLK